MAFNETMQQLKDLIEEQAQQKLAEAGLNDVEIRARTFSTFGDR